MDQLRLDAYEAEIQDKLAKAKAYREQAELTADPRHKLSLLKTAQWTESAAIKLAERIAGRLRAERAHTHGAEIEEG